MFFIKIVQIVPELNLLNFEIEIITIIIVFVSFFGGYFIIFKIIEFFQGKQKEKNCIKNTITNEEEYYKILGIRPTDDCEQIRKAYY